MNTKKLLPICCIALMSACHNPPAPQTSTLPPPMPPTARTSYRPSQGQYQNPPEQQSVATPPAPVNSANPAIDDYVLFLSQAEASKKQLLQQSAEESKAFMAQSTSLRGSNDPAEFERVFTLLSQQNSGYIATLIRIEDYLKQKPVPGECSRLATKYLSHIAALRQGLERTQSAMQRHSLTEIDSEVRNQESERTAQEADAELSAVCQRYKVARSFQVSGLR